MRAIFLLQGSQRHVRDKVGLDQGWLVNNRSNNRYTSGFKALNASDRAWPKVRVVRRFGAALVLNDIMQEVSPSPECYFPAAVAVVHAVL